MKLRRSIWFEARDRLNYRRLNLGIAQWHTDDRGGWSLYVLRRPVLRKDAVTGTVGRAK